MGTSKILLVEGNDDLHVLAALCKKFNVPQSFHIKDCEGINELIKNLPVEFKAPDLKILGIIVDADADILSRWESLKNSLIKLEFNAPNNLPIEGLILTNENNIRIGIWIMPNNNSNGMLEDFIELLIPNKDQLLPIVKNHLNTVETQRLNKYKEAHKSKAVIHSWLALQERPGSPMGLSITNKALDAKEAVCKPLINWLNNLFNNEITDTHTTQ
ncbi:MAG: DUF3226 domain-containing protein [Bacteroidia bacterium]